MFPAAGELKPLEDHPGDEHDGVRGRDMGR
jgi:hypothetical protein